MPWHPWSRTSASEQVRHILLDQDMADHDWATRVEQVLKRRPARPSCREVEMLGPTLVDDILFGLVLCTESNRTLLGSLLNALLGLSGSGRLDRLEFVNPAPDKRHGISEDGIFDLKGCDSTGRTYHIQVQLVDRRARAERALCHLARLFATQPREGDSCAQIIRTIGICLADVLLFPDSEDMHSTCRPYDDTNGKTLTDVLELHFFELAKFPKRRVQELETPQDMWLHILKFGALYGGGRMTLPEELRAEDGIERALQEWRKVSASRELREFLEMREKADHDRATRLEQARRQGFQIGFQQGLQQAREKARLEGREAGRREVRQKAARQMREAGLTREQIQQITGLDAEDLD
ncbi:MAG: Rpn family recombination-promoting nuclease/putative transposase [Candidatus Riflebacteria bacterium]|nr:Rpn family recombination-promoting nuclease/putative transposase [Candidatus Riflebacteria bacterium]